MSGILLRPIGSFLSGRYQQVVLNGQASSWSPILDASQKGYGQVSYLRLVDEGDHRGKI